MAQFEVIALDTATPQLRAPGSGDSYLMPRSLAISTGAVTASTPVLDLSQSWNASGVTFTGIKFNVTNTTSAAASTIFDFQENGASVFSLRPAGAINETRLHVGNATRKYFTILGTSGSDGAFFFYPGGAYNSGSAIAAYGHSATGGAVDSVDIFRNGFSLTARFDATGSLNLQGGGAYAWTNSTGGGGSQGTVDTFLYRDAVAGTIAQRNGANGQTFRLYGNYLTGSDFRRLKMAMSLAGVAEIKPEDGGTYAGSTVLHISGLPTSNPGPGILWNNAGVVVVGT